MSRNTTIIKEIKNIENIENININVNELKRAHSMLLSKLLKIAILTMNNLQVKTVPVLVQLFQMEV